LCDIKAILNGIIKKPTDETAGSEVCLVDVFTKRKSKACTGVCLICKCRVTSGKFDDRSEKSLSQNTKDDDIYRL
jgi:hypothetical protein